MPRGVAQLLAKYPPEIRGLALKARDHILELIPGAEETVDSSAPVIGYGYGTGYKGLICTLLMSKAGVKLGLVRGAELEDPSGLLEGGGRAHRYVPLQTVADLRRPGVRQILRLALAAWKARQ